MSTKVKRYPPIEIKEVASSVVDYVKPISSENSKTSIEDVRLTSSVVHYVKPVKDKIRDIPSLEKYLQERIKVSDNAGPLGDSITISRENSTIMVSSRNPFSKRFQFLAENIGRWLLNDDATIEVLSRLPIEFVVEMKSVCKWWYHLTTCHHFRNLHFQNSQSTRCGMFIQGFMDCLCCEYVLDNKFVGYMAFGAAGKCMAKQNLLNFLPEKVVITASCNGLLICRSLVRREIGHKFRWWEGDALHSADSEFFIYVCNPFTKEFNVLKPNFTNTVRCGIGFAFDSLDPPTSFEVVVVEALQKSKSSFCYMFKIYSSKTETWRVSKEICFYPYKLYFQRHVYLNGVFYWLTAGRSILMFHLKKEKFEFINLPDPLTKNDDVTGMCLGESEGCLHYIFSSTLELRVWILNLEHSKPEWVLKHFWRISSEAELVHPRYREEVSISLESDEIHTPNYLFHPFSHVDGILYVVRSYTKYYCAYNLKTGYFKELCLLKELPGKCNFRSIGLSYSRSLLPVCNKPQSSFS